MFITITKPRLEKAAHFVAQTTCQDCRSGRPRGQGQKQKAKLSMELNAEFS